MPESDAAHTPPADPLAVLLSLARRARQAGDCAELGFLAMNDTHQLARYRQAALWFAEGGVQALSGVLQPEANAPYVDWLERLCRHLRQQDRQDGPIDASDLPGELAAEWHEWLPAQGLWLRLPNAAQVEGSTSGGIVLFRDAPWPVHEVPLLQEWRDIWLHEWLGRLRAAPWSWRHWSQNARRLFRRTPAMPWYRQRRWLVIAAILTATALPVRLTVLAPGELVPVNPALVRAPIDGVVGEFLVKPNQLVKAGQPLFSFDPAALQSKLDVARQTLTTAEVEYRQAAQSALSDAKSKALLAGLAGKIEERRADVDYLQGQFDRSRVLAPQDGMALFDDPSEWTGKPVSTGERIMRIAQPEDAEIEAWLAIGDAIPLAENAPVKLYLNASPMSPVAAHLRYLSHDAVQRPDGSYAYRVRATLDESSTQRIGLKGTAKISGHWVPLVYWVLRRPWAAVRQFTGY